MTIIGCGTCGDEIKRLQMGSARLAGVCEACKRALRHEVANARAQLGLWMRNDTR